MDMSAEVYDSQKDMIELVPSSFFSQTVHAEGNGYQPLKFDSSDLLISFH